MEAGKDLPVAGVAESAGIAVSVREQIVAMIKII
jgi:hypothetical protein